ncbi:MAG: endonuclease/exonuclease/phosphatase family protein [Tenuifilaceae bacterium]
MISNLRIIKQPQFGINSCISFYYLLMLFAFLLSGCEKDNKNHKPILDITEVVEGLSVTLTGSVIDPDGEIADLYIEWGDSKFSRLYDKSYPNLQVNHLYSNPATYSISITATDNEGDTTLKLISIPVEFKETSLAGIKETLFKTASNEYLILTINLHTYQETQQSEKLNMVADVIGKMDIDFIAFQECAQNKSTAISEGIIRVDNMALLVSNSLKENYSVDYNFVWDWAHYGWNVWEEGVAVLSKHSLLGSDSRYVSSYQGTSSITSRKVIFGSYQTPSGRFDVFSAHTHWRTSATDEEQNNQIKNIKLMVAEKENLATVAASFVCGDFNGNPTSDYPWSEGYNTMVLNGGYIDSFLAANPSANSKPAQSIFYTIGGDLPGRIDYIFIKSKPHITVIDSQIIFKSDVVGKVSDHYGVLTKVAYTN